MARLQAQLLERSDALLTLQQGPTPSAAPPAGSALAGAVSREGEGEGEEEAVGLGRRVQELEGVVQAREEALAALAADKARLEKEVQDARADAAHARGVVEATAAAAREEVAAVVAKGAEAAAAAAEAAEDRVGAAARELECEREKAGELREQVLVLVAEAGGARARAAAGAARLRDEMRQVVDQQVALKLNPKP